MWQCQVDQILEALHWNSLNIFRLSPAMVSDCDWVIRALYAWIAKLLIISETLAVRCKDGY